MDVMSRPDRAIFRLPACALFLPIMLLFLITPLATVAAGWGVLFVVPVGALVWVVVTRTTPTTGGPCTYGLLGRQADGLDGPGPARVPDSRWAIAVGTDGRRLRLPMVRPRDLPLLTRGVRRQPAARRSDVRPSGDGRRAGAEPAPTPAAIPTRPESDRPSDTRRAGIRRSPGGHWPPDVAATSDVRVAEPVPTRSVTSSARAGRTVR